MKIAYVHDCPVPSTSANAVHVMKMCAALADTGAEVTLMCPYDDNVDVKEDVYSLYGVNPSFNIERIRSNKLFQKVSAIDKITIAYKTAQKIRRDKFDFVLGRSMWALYFLKSHTPFIFETHMLPMQKRRKAERSLFESSNLIKIIMITEGLKSDYLNTFPSLKSDQIVVLQDGADVAKEVSGFTMPMQEKQLVIKQRPVIGYLGHLYPGKCMEILSQVAAMRPQYDFHVVGGKEEWVEKWKSDDSCRDLQNIKFYGYINNNTIPYYYSNFDISILPFYNKIVVGTMKNGDIARWTSPLKLFEAMSYGKAILATNLDTVKEVLTDGVDCLLESPENIDGWCKKLDMLVEDERLRVRLGTAAKQLFEEKYTWAIRAKSIINIMKSFKQ